jgi:hypothetical protein
MVDALKLLLVDMALAIALGEVEFVLAGRSVGLN